MHQAFPDSGDGDQRPSERVPPCLSRSEPDDTRASAFKIGLALIGAPAAVLLPPLYALLVPIPRMIITQVRIRRRLFYRRAYTAAAVGLAYAAPER